jgi:protein CpxP
MRNVERKQRIAGMLRAAAVMLCLCGLAAVAAQGQDEAPPAPPAGQQQGPPAGGPGGRGGMMDPARMTERLTKMLNLTADQQTQVKAVLVEHQEKMKSNPEMSREDRRAAREAMETKLKAILTPDQQAKYAEMQAKMREHRGGEEQGAPPSTPPPPPGA